MKGRQKRALGAVFGLDNFGVNLTQLASGAVSALRHAHTRQDEFVYVLQGRPVLRTDAGDTPMAPGMGASFKAGMGDAHQLLNPTDETVVYLEVGDRSEVDAASVEARTLGATVWAAAGFKDTLLRWNLKPEVVCGNETAVQPGVQA